MLKNVTLQDIKSINGYETYTYNLIDTNFKKHFKVEVAGVSADLRKAIIANSTLEFIYNEYRYSKECPFKNIKIFYSLRKTNDFNDEHIRDTKFFETHQKIMDKILMPIAITPTQTNWGGTNAGYYNYTATTKYYIYYYC